MKIIQAVKVGNQNWKYFQESDSEKKSIVCFGNRFLLEKEETIKNIRQEFPYKHIVFGSTAGKFYVVMYMMSPFQ
jgi:hypothetical protein